MCFLRSALSWKRVDLWSVSGSASEKGAGPVVFLASRVPSVTRRLRAETSVFLPEAAGQGRKLWKERERGRNVICVRECAFSDGVSEGVDVFDLVFLVRLPWSVLFKVRSVSWSPELMFSLPFLT